MVSNRVKRNISGTLFFVGIPHFNDAKGIDIITERIYLPREEVDFIETDY